MSSVLVRRLVCIIITIGYYTQQRLFAKRKIKFSITVIKEGSKNQIIINSYTYDLFYIMRTNDRQLNFLCT